MDTKAATHAPAAARRAPIPEDMLRKYARDKQQRLCFDGTWRLQPGGGGSLAERVQAVLPGASSRVEGTVSKRDLRATYQAITQRESLPLRDVEANGARHMAQRIVAHLDSARAASASKQQVQAQGQAVERHVQALLAAPSAAFGFPVQALPGASTQAVKERALAWAARAWPQETRQGRLTLDQIVPAVRLAAGEMHVRAPQPVATQPGQAPADEPAQPGPQAQPLAPAAPAAPAAAGKAADPKQPR